MAIGTAPLRGSAGRLGPFYSKLEPLGHRRLELTLDIVECPAIDDAILRV